MHFVKTVNGQCLVGPADSQWDGDKRLHAENKRIQRLLVELWCVVFLAETPRSLWKCCEQHKTKTLFLLFVALLFPLACISSALSKSYWFKRREIDGSVVWKLFSGWQLPRLPSQDAPLFCWVSYFCVTANAARNTNNEWQSWIPCWGAQASTDFPFHWKIKTPNLILSLAIKLAIKIANNSVAGFTVLCATPGRAGVAFPKVLKCHSQRSWKRPLPVTFYCVCVCVALGHANTHTFRVNCVFPNANTRPQVVCG